MGHGRPRPMPRCRRRVLLQAVGWRTEKAPRPGLARTHLGRDTNRLRFSKTNKDRRKDAHEIASGPSRQLYNPRPEVTLKSKSALGFLQGQVGRNTPSRRNWTAMVKVVCWVWLMLSTVPAGAQ